MVDTWDPDRYHLFAEQRARPFQDLVALVRPCPDGSLLDLGCGSGELTAQAMASLGVSTALGLDASPSMLERAGGLDTPGLDFVAGDLGDPAAVPAVGSRRWDVIVANASLQWVPDHVEVLRRWRGLLAPGGQLAVQVPANPEHPSHVAITEVLHSEPFFSLLGGAPPPDPLLSVLAPERYAEALWAMGATDQRVLAEVYGMEMADSDAVADWTSGTALNRVRAVLDDERFAEFTERYRELLARELGGAAPYFYAFKRILMWARFP
ncbi:MAG: methyltransferase domain-containing protein [Microthrixaceae bacterium]